MYSLFSNKIIGKETVNENIDVEREDEINVIHVIKHIQLQFVIRLEYYLNSINIFASNLAC